MRREQRTDASRPRGANIRWGREEPGRGRCQDVSDHRTEGNQGAGLREVRTPEEEVSERGALREWHLSQFHQNTRQR